MCIYIIYIYIGYLRFVLGYELSIPANCDQKPNKNFEMTSHVWVHRCLAYVPSKLPFRYVSVMENSLVLPYHWKNTRYGDVLPKMSWNHPGYPPFSDTPIFMILSFFRCSSRSLCFNPHLTIIYRSWFTLW